MAPPRDTPASPAEQAYARSRASGHSVEEALSLLRESQDNIIEAIKAVRAVEGVTLHEAKVVVATSGAWRDIHEASTELHDMLEEVFRDDAV